MMKIQIKILGSENCARYGVSSGTVIEEDFEKYVAAVVASEIGNAPLEACKAQAVASRSFAYRYILKDKPIPDSSSAQVYRLQRYSSAYQICIDAAEATKGKILTYHGEVADTYFCHANGGSTVSSEEKWGGERPYLVSKPDSWDSATHVVRTGHGVGMSQAGAKYAARQGISCQKILAFYYPGTELTDIRTKEGNAGMITLTAFLNGCKKNAARIKGYKLGCNGSNGLSDCIGYPIGALALEGQKWNGTHGCNYAKRNRIRNFHMVTKASQLKLGELVFKIRKPGEAKYDLPGQYKTSGDLNDYYHVGVVTSVNPLEISHCSGGGMHYDKSLGKWCCAGECSLVDYGGSGSVPAPTPIEEDTSASAVTGPGKAIVDVPNDTTVNVRSSASASAKVVTRLNEGTAVIVQSVSGSWAKIAYAFTKEGTGYVMSKFLSEDGTVDVPDDTTVNVRSGASTSSPVITKLPEGTKVTVQTRAGSWCGIRYAESRSGIGYVMSKYLRKG